MVTGGSDNGTDTYSYDFENRLIGLVKGTGGGPGTYAYSYDYRTRRIVRDESAASGVLTDLVFSGGTSVQEYAGSISSANLTVEYVRGSDYGGGVGGILYSLRGGTPSYTHENRRGDVVAKTDGSGSLTYQAQYEGFGQQVATNGSTLDRQKSNSKDTDPTNLVDEGFRYRDLETGMFINRDPAGFVDGPNLYTYVIQNPWTHFDPEGLTMEDLHNYWIGIGNGFIGIGEGAAHAVEHPISTAEGVASAVEHPINTAIAVKDAAVKSYNSGPEGQGELTANVLAVLAPGAAASSVAKAPEVADAANAASKVDKVATADAKIAEAVEANTSKAATTPEQSAEATTSTGLGPNDPAQRYQGPWTQRDLDRAKDGKGPIDMVPTKDSKGRDLPLELHHGDQMPGAGIHEVSPAEHDNPALHPNESNQGVDRTMRQQDRQLHWQMRGQEQGNPPPTKQT